MPAGTLSFALVCDDLDARDGRRFRWGLCDIPGDKREIIEAYPRTMTRTTFQVENDFGSMGYFGACGSDGLTHHFRFRLFALRVPTLALRPGTSCAELLSRALESTVEVAQLIGARCLPVLDVETLPPTAPPARPTWVSNPQEPARPR